MTSIAVDAVAPGVPLHELRLLAAVLAVELEEHPAGELAHLVELGLDRSPHVVRKGALEVGA